MTGQSIPDHDADNSHPGLDLTSHNSLDHETHTTYSNFFSRAIDNDKFIGNVLGSTLAGEELKNSDTNISAEVLSYDMQVENLAGNSAGLVIGSILHYFLRNKYVKRRSLNPFFRNFKTLANVGATLGNSLAYALPFFPASLKKLIAAFLSGILSLVFGLIAIPYWLIRQYVLGINPEEEGHKEARHDQTGNESWSKYGKTLLVYGVALGQFIGILQTLTGGGNLIANMAMIGGFTGLAAFTLGLIIIPLVNKYFNGAFRSQDKNAFRNNYVRSGMMLGLSIGTTLGFILGTLIFPGIGTAAGMALGGVVGTLMGGFILGAKGQKISRIMHPTLLSSQLKVAEVLPTEPLRNCYVLVRNQNENILYYYNFHRKKEKVHLNDPALFHSKINYYLNPPEQKPLQHITLEKEMVNDLIRSNGGHTTQDSENSWDYASRSTAYVFGSIGTIIGFFLPVPGGALVGAALGAAMFGIIGWFTGIKAVTLSQQRHPVEVKANSLPWTQRIGMGSNIFSIVGGVIGFCVGAAFGGPLGAMAGTTLGYAAGAVIGSIVGYFYDPAPSATSSIPTPEQTISPTAEKTEKSEFNPEISLSSTAQIAQRSNLKLDMMPSDELTPSPALSNMQVDLILSEEKLTIDYSQPNERHYYGMT